MADSGETLLTERETSVLRWRCRRGLVENDLFIERFFNTHGAQLSHAQARGLAQLMDLSDNDLLDLLLVRTEPSGELDTEEVRGVLAQMRQRP
ncbi:succinate dehydrogenase assembly factor 2 [Melaminivora jejuensis]|uniref:FAD assembly factor SdhE n=1 Tax=Melaminivora jejuensis TaxID=1267217 RepID=UPI001AE0A8F7|nr:succinate dehydrogenase assembly factor 2 [Melaminivora jejuensis]UHJ66111.1 succinate dehydrogenase assembly factor 2 [Melaminivora jejuensis]